MTKRLLLHTCCAPCISGCLDKLPENYELTSYFYNPNIQLTEEFNSRLVELERFAKIKGFSVSSEFVENDSWVNNIRPLRKLGERSNRCIECYSFRLEASFQYAKLYGYDLVGTTLTVSPYKMSDEINRIGQELSEKYGVEYLISDFKKKNGYKNSIENSKKYNLYRQSYCGCVYSQKERDKHSRWNRKVSA
jgi:predicted adenine nucleotide alpha hydrolase (AANH) superfamily ATPase